MVGAWPKPPLTVGSSPVADDVSLVVADADPEGLADALEEELVTGSAAGSVSSPQAVSVASSTRAEPRATSDVRRRT
jgi:hypothetical protein